MTASIIIPTYNGAHRISNTLDAIINQSVSPEEVIVVIDGSTDQTEKVVEEYLKKFINLKIIKQPNLGRAGVRNTGVKYATSDLLIFYDDDMRPCRDSIARHVEFHKNCHNAICGGNQLEDVEVMKSDIQHYKALLSRKWTAKYDEGLNLLSEKNLFLTAANMSMTKTLFNALGGFNEKLRDAEDYELAVRAYERGIPIYFDKSNIAWHDDFITCKSYINRQRQYNAMTEPLNALFPSIYLRKPKNRDHLPFLKRLVYGFFVNFRWSEWIDGQKLIFLPKRIRYKIYGVVIAALGHYFPEERINLN
jgi:glycosyltransferase involved in cell wall biosynthesis